MFLAGNPQKPLLIAVKEYSSLLDDNSYDEREIDVTQKIKSIGRVSSENCIKNFHLTSIPLLVTFVSNINDITDF